MDMFCPRCSYIAMPFKNFWQKSYLTDNPNFSAKPIFYVLKKSSYKNECIYIILVLEKNISLFSIFLSEKYIFFNLEICLHFNTVLPQNI